MLSNAKSLRLLTLEEARRLKEIFNQWVSIPAVEFEELLKFMRVKHIQRGNLYQAAGGKANSFGIVLWGGFSVCQVSLNGSPVIREFCIENMLVGNFRALLTGSAADTRIEAFEKTAVAVIDYHAFQALYERHSVWERLGRKIAEMQYVESEKRQYQFRFLNAEQRYQAFLTDLPGLYKRVSQADIAAYIGVHPVSLSRLLGRKRKPAHPNQVNESSTKS